MVVAEQVQARLHHGEDLVDLRLPRIGAAASGKRTERLRRFVREEDVDVAQLLAGLDLLADEVPPLVGELGRLRGSLLRVRQLRRRGLVPRGRERPAESGDFDVRAKALTRGVGQPFRADQSAIVDVMQIRRQIAGRDGVEVVVVAVDPVDRGAQRFVAPVLVGDVADAEPEGDVGMARDDAARGGEIAVDVAERADGYLAVCAGTSRSVLSQMKSLLL